MRKIRVAGLFICAIGIALFTYELFLQYFVNVTFKSTLSGYQVLGEVLVESGVLLFRLIRGA